LLKSNHEQDLEKIKAIHQTELEKVQAAIDEAEIQRLSAEAEVSRSRSRYHIYICVCVCVWKLMVWFPLAILS
jgi:hypothetical protein